MRDAFNRFKNTKENLGSRFMRLRRRCLLKKTFYKFKESNKVNKLKRLIQRRIKRTFMNFRNKIRSRMDIIYIPSVNTQSIKSNFSIIKPFNVDISKQKLNFGLQYRLRNAFLRWKRLSKGNFFKRIMLKKYLQRWKSVTENMAENRDLRRQEIPPEVIFRNLATRLRVKRMKEHIISKAIKSKPIHPKRAKFDSRSKRIIDEEHAKMLKKRELMDQQEKRIKHPSDEHHEEHTRWRKLSQKFRAIVRISKMIYRNK